MLKRKLWRMSFLCQGTYLLIAASNGGNLKHSAESIISSIDSTDSITVLDKAASPKVHLNAGAAKFATSYIKENKEALEKIRERSKGCFGMMDSVFEEYDLPVELKYLAVVESELKSDALSPVGAAGPWQFMPATARVLGLKVNGKYDERKNFTKSTVAAAKYISDLYGEFGDWLLVLAAYNGGPGPVYTAIRKSGSRNFWKMQQYFPAETRGHVKRFISTHFYFEGAGGITTLTKAEMAIYHLKLNELNAAKDVKLLTGTVSAICVDSVSNTVGRMIAER